MTSFTHPDEGCAHPATRDRATRASHQAATRLDHTASVPCAFTPGPWFYGDEDEGVVGVEYVQVHAGSYGDNSFRSVASVEAPFDGDKWLTLDDSTRANARLIAAAPELFEAVNAAFDFLGGVDGAADIRGRLLAVILKARGEHS